MAQKFDSYSEFFKIATGNPPYPYQKQIAETGNRFPPLLSVPTGAGKTAAVALAWLWRRRYSPDSEIRKNTPRRLVYCLPMRVLTEQTRDALVLWLNNLGILGGGFLCDEKSRVQTYDPFASDDDPSCIRVHMLMGGEVDRDWDRYPERDTILVGTQDQLLSRALNRGYAMSRFRWPVQFGLLNSDTLWVFDEVQLMGNGLATSLQLAGFRQNMGAVHMPQSIWMSATLHPDWMRTYDAPLLPAPVTLSPEDKSYPSLKPRLEAVKSVQIFPQPHPDVLPQLKPHLEAVKSVQSENCDLKNKEKDVAALVEKHHHPGSLTLVVVNTVRRAQEIYSELKKRSETSARSKTSDIDSGNFPELILIHSRFREPDRERNLARLKEKPCAGGTIAVCTQVIEAGVDISARLLVTDLAPWPSLVQRFGRCNRAGEFEQAEIIWLDISKDKKSIAPYTLEDLTEAQKILSDLQNACPDTLPKVGGNPDWRNVIRHRDMLELFDTSPDLSGTDLDVSRFIREQDEHDVQVFWREIEDNNEQDPMEAQPRPEELCPVPVRDIRSKKELLAWRWDFHDKIWIKVRPEQAYPGLVLLLNTSEGGYTADEGWNPKSRKKVSPIHIPEYCRQKGEAHDDDFMAEQHSGWESIAEHSDAVAARLEELLSHLQHIPDVFAEALLIAARWHDAGKAHPQFQKSVASGVNPPEEKIWGKVPHKMHHYERRGFRHELASAFAMLESGLPDLPSYLAVAHHGKVRLSIRSMPFESPDPEKPFARFARGLLDGDILPACDLGGGVTMPETCLDLSYMEIGEGEKGPSWLARMLALRDDPDIGPFRLAYLEALLRIADWRASEGDA